MTLGSTPDPTIVPPPYSEDSEYMPLTVALQKAREIQKLFPDRQLCGGVALILLGFLHNDGRLHDLDFAVPILPGDLGSLAGTDAGNALEYFRTAVGSDCMRQFYAHYTSDRIVRHCLFAVDQIQMHKPIVVDGILCQNPLDILHFKRSFGRPKDIAAVKSIMTAICGHE